MIVVRTLITFDKELKRLSKKYYFSDKELQVLFSQVL